MTTKEELAKRGKRAEAAMKKYLTKLKDTQASFDFQRQYDARSARGRFQAQAGDFLLWRREGDLAHSAVLEVKEVHHDYRLPSKNFSAEQIGKARRRAMAGAQVIVAVFHTTIERWRFPSFEQFTTQLSAPSWDLSRWMEYVDLESGLRIHHPTFFDFGDF